MTFTLLHMFIIFCVGIILGIMFGLGLHNLRSSSRKDRSKPTGSIATEFEKQKTPTSPKNKPELQSIYATTSFSDAQEPGQTNLRTTQDALHSDETQDFQVRIDIHTLAEVVDIPEEESIKEDATLVIPRDQ